MTDSASINKTSVEKFNSWRNEVLENWDELTDDTQLGINSFFCRMHHLLALSSAADSAMKNIEAKWEERFGKLGMTSLPEFQKWNTRKESAMQRAIRTTCELLGPRGDQKSGCRSHWMEFLDGKTSYIGSFRGNRFNSLFKNASSVIHHLKDISQFLEGGYITENLLVKSVKVDLQSAQIISSITAASLLEKFLTDPLARIITDKAIPVTTLHEFFIPMVQRLKHFSSDSSDLLSEDCELIFPTHPPVADDLFDSIFKEINEAANKDLIKQALEVICEAFVPVASRQLKDHLPGGIFDNPSDKIKEQSKSTPKHNLSGENDFGHLDYSQKQKPNASTKHHSSIVMTKINHTVSWLSKKSYSQRIKLQKLARIKAPKQTQKFQGGQDQSKQNEDKSF